jgi:hypothetical protein
MIFIQLHVLIYIYIGSPAPVPLVLVKRPAGMPCQTNVDRTETAVVVRRRPQRQCNASPNSLNINTHEQGVRGVAVKLLAFV